jgi:SAM-dependent methyltransferase
LTTPTTPHVNKYRSKISGSNDERLTTEVFERNKKPISKALFPYLDKITGDALEIGSGTGQHLSYLAKNFPHIIWHGTDIDEVHCKSIDAWAKFNSLNLPHALALDAASDWSSVLKEYDSFNVIISMNVIHISPISTLEGIFLNSARFIKNDGILVFYGPFKKGNKHTGEGNKIFDQRLRSENSTWGVRCISTLERLAADNKFDSPEVIEMPANNYLLVFKKSD